MKKVSLFILVLAFSILMLLFTACNGTGNGSEDTEVTGDNTSSTEHVHYFCAPHTVREATCTEGGLEEQECACGEKNTETIPAKGHNFVNRVCDRCGEKEISNGLKYTLSSNKLRYSVSGLGSCTDTDIVIPPTYEGKPVSYIDDNAFSGCTNLTSVMIPDSVANIGSGAFYGCTGLTSAKLGSGVLSIGEHAFYGCTGLASITVSDGVTSIGFNVFYNTAYYNNEANWGDGVLYIGNYLIKVKESISGNYTVRDGTGCIAESAFYKCAELTSVTIPGSVPGIGRDVFSGCTKLASVTIPDGVTGIGIRAFENCSGLTSVTISDSVKYIETEAFRGCTSLESITMPFVGNTQGGTRNTHIGFIFGASGSHENGKFVPASLKNVVITKAADIYGYAFSGCTGLTSVTLPDGVTRIEEFAFSDCSGLVSVTLPDSVKIIKEQAFKGCSSLSSITIPGGITIINYCLFKDCTNLTSVTISDKVGVIDIRAFENCVGLTSIIFKGTKAKWDSIIPGTDWNKNTGAYTVHCTDVDISK